MSSKTRVYIVDDHPLVRELLLMLLRQQGDIEVCGEAEDKKAAMAGILQDQPDVAIVDLSLKDGSGLDLIKDLADQIPSVQVVVLSMHEEVFYAERALRAGARAYVRKRESTASILEAIRQVRAGNIFAGPDLLAKLAERMVNRTAFARLHPVESLSDRELDVFRRLGCGESTRQVADNLNVSIKTVQAYCARIKDKLGLESATELVREAVRWVEQDGRV